MSQILITGHRDIFEYDIPVISKRLKERILLLKNNKTKVKFWIGQAEGVDQLAHQALADLDIEAHVLPQYKGKGYSSPDVFYEEQAKELILKCDHIIALWTGNHNFKPGGTSDIIHKAKCSQMGLYRVLCLAWFDLTSFAYFNAQNPLQGF